MSVENKEKIDFVSLEKGSGDIILTISDHLSWDDEEHIILLQDKINSYIEYIENGQIQELFTDSGNRNRVISIEFLHHPTGITVKFLEMVGNELKNNGIGFRYRQSHFNSPDSGRWIKY